jgi:beta-galactosidase/beta-glucuronidase
LGEYAGCFSASYFDLSQAIRWGEDNTLVVRIGAHPAVLPENFPTGSDFEKIKWTPGIYDNVSVIFCENPMVRQVQVAPRIQSGEIVVQTLLVNLAASPVSSDLKQTVKAWKGSAESAAVPHETILLQPGEEKMVTQTFKIPKARLWSPEDPFLYVLTTETTGDRLATRFGMREFTFDGKTRRAYLNGKVYYLRGSNITLHRFFEDPLSRGLPWDEAWVRRLLVELPKALHWNAFRFCIGPVPDRWLDIADEAGLLVQNEFFIWNDSVRLPPYHAGELITQYSEWMRDHWNHPSNVIIKPDENEIRKL